MRLIFAALIVAFLVINTAFAAQLLNKGYFLYNNLTIGQGSSAMVGVNTSSGVNLLVIHSSDFDSYINNGNVNAVYNMTVSSGIYQLNLSAGNYTIITSALKTTSLDVSALAVPLNEGRLINMNGNYEYNFSLSNYSDLKIDLLSTVDYSNNQLSANLSGDYSIINTDKNLDTLNVSLNRGNYTLLLNSHGKMQLFVLLNATPQLANPLSQALGGNSYATGVVSYGLYNVSGRLYPYQVRTNEVIGVANITALSSYSPNPLGNSSASGSSLQLNVGLNTYIKNKLVVLWMQDVVDFNTTSGQYYLVDNIWNNTSPNANLTGKTVLGMGNLSSCASCGNQSFYVDSYPVYYLNYTFPLNIKLVMLENQTVNGSEVSFGYQILRNGTSGLGPLFFFDRVLIPGSSNSTFLVTPYYQTPSDNTSSGNFYDSELVFAGESGGANAYFNQLNSSLWMYYSDNGIVVPFPSVYTFGLSTAETATNVAVRNSSDGAYVTTGKLNFTTDIFAANALSSIANYVSSTSNYSRPVTTTSQGTGGNPFQVTSISPAEIDTLEVLAGASVVLILVIGFLLLRRR